MSLLKNILGGLSMSGGRSAVANVDDSGRVTGQYWPSGGYSGGLYGSSPATGLDVGEREAMACATVYACTRAISETLASLPGLVFQRTAEDSRSRARESDAWAMLHDQPCPHIDSMQWSELGTTRSLNRGNFFGWMERDARDQVVAIHPIHNSRVIPRKNSEDGQLEWHVLTDSASGGGGYGYEYFILSSRDIFNLVGFGSLDGTGVISSGVLPRATEEISLDIAQQLYGSAFFGQGGRPSGVVEHPGFIDDEVQRRTFREDINQIHSGRENWHQVGVLWAGAQWKELSVAPEQAQFVSSRGFQSKVLCRFYNVPPSVVQIFDDFKFSTVDAMLRQFVMLTIRPWAVRWERAINRQVLRRPNVETGRLESSYGNEDLFFEILLDGLLRGSPKEQAEVNAIKRQWGVLNADEWRSQENLNPLANEQGQAYLAPLNHTTLDRIIAGENGKLGGGSNSSSASAELPRFDRERIIELAEWVRDRRRGAQVHVGATLGEQESPDQMEDFGWRSVAENTARLARNEQQAMRRIALKCSDPADAVSSFVPQFGKVLSKQCSLLESANLVAFEQIAASRLDGDEDAIQKAAASSVLKQAVDEYRSVRLREETESAVEATKSDDELLAWKEQIEKLPTDESSEAVAQWFVDLATDFFDQRKH